MNEMTTAHLRILLPLISVIASLGQGTQAQGQAHELQFNPRLQYAVKHHTTGSIALPAVYRKAGQVVLENLQSNLTKTACDNDTFALLSDLLVGQIYAIRVIDSYGKPPPGILDGHIDWLGSYDECSKQQEVQNGDYFQGKYCKVSIGGPQMSNPLPLGLQLSVGICVPKSCSANQTEWLIQLGTLLLEHVISNVSVSSVVCDEDLEWTATHYAGIAITSIIAAVCVTGTLVDAILRYCSCHRGDCSVVNADGKPDGQCDTDRRCDTDDDSLLDPSNDQSGLLQDSTALTQLDTRQSPCILGKICRVFVCFSWISNGEKLLRTGIRDDYLRPINGIRVLSMSWVILGHTYVFCIYNYSNLLQAGELVQRFSFQAIINATVSVDSFFFLSGLLVCYLTLQELEKKDGRLNWFLFYFHRFWRLTPAYMFVLMIFLSIFPLLVKGPYAIQGSTARGGLMGEEQCKKYWWTNLLYINNFIPSALGDECIGWSWYLANDMQFYVISPALIFLLYRFEVIGLGVIGLLVTLCLSLTGGMATKYHASATLIGEGGGANENGSLGSLYIRPYYRIAPYLVGMLTGYALYKYKDRFRPHWPVVVGGWGAATAINLVVLYGLYHYYHTAVDMPQHLASFYIATNRFAWSLGLAWLSFACLTGYGGPINAILAHGVWAPLGRLTYTAYLIHPIVMYLIYMNLRVPIYYTDMTMVYYFLGHIVLSFGAATVISLMIEAPMMSLEKLVLKK